MPVHAVTGTVKLTLPMNHSLSLLACAVLIAVSGAAGAQKANEKKLYCWNDNGRKVCGDALPSTAVDSARTEFSAKSGRTTGQVDRALTGAERDAALAKAEAERAAAAVAEAAARRDQAMAQSYATEDDLRRAFGERLAVLDETIKASRLGVAGRRQTLVSLLRRAGEDELHGKAVAKATSNSIRTQHDQLIHQQQMLVQQLAAREVVDEELEAALVRYHALRNGKG